MTIKITITPEHEDEKRHFHSNRLLLLLLAKSNASSDLFYAWLLILAGQALGHNSTCPMSRSVITPFVTCFT